MRLLWPDSRQHRAVGMFGAICEMVRRRQGAARRRQGV